MSCTKCNKTSMPYGTVYKCADPDCSCVAAVPRYRLCFIGADDTGEAEFVFFDRAGKDLVGKSLITLLLGGKSSGVPLDEIVRTARGDDTVPREVTALVGQRHRFVVSISSRSFLPDTEVTSFQVNRLDLPVGAPIRNAVLYCKAGSSGQSESNTSSQAGTVILSTDVLPSGSIPLLSLTGSEHADGFPHEGIHPKGLTTPKANKSVSSPASGNKRCELCSSKNAP